MSESSIFQYLQSGLLDCFIDVINQIHMIVLEHHQLLNCGKMGIIGLTLQFSKFQKCHFLQKDKVQVTSDCDS